MAKVDRAFWLIVAVVSFARLLHPADVDHWIALLLAVTATIVAAKS